MPFKRTAVLAAGDVGANPWLGVIGPTIAIIVDPDTFATSEVDANGFLKPGVPLTRAGILVGAGVAVYGCTVEYTKIAATNSAGDRTAAANIEVAIGLSGAINRAAAEDILGRAYTANEIAGFDLAGSRIRLVS